MAVTTTPNAVSQGFAPVIGGRPKVLILGSLPSQQSLCSKQYYANPRNAFWRIMGEIVGFDSNTSYDTRCNTLINNGIMLWDVLESSRRPGSLDAAIDVASARENDFSALLQQHPEIMLICFNGMKARELFNRFVLVSISLPDGCKLINLPSTSPAHAAMRVEEKLGRWSVIGELLDRDGRRNT